MCRGTWSPSKMNKIDELTEVTAPNENEYPYGAKVTIFLNGMVQFELDIKR